MPGKFESRSPNIPTLWEVKGGWSDDVDWPTRIAELASKTGRWLEVFKDLSRRGSWRPVGWTDNGTSDVSAKARRQWAHTPAGDSANDLRLEPGRVHLSIGPRGGRA
jgi:hypothetical protein